MRLSAALVVATVLVGCGSDATPPAESPASSPSAAVEDPGKAACQRFYELAGEIDLLIGEEGRAALQEVWELAQDAENEELQQAARDMLEYYTNLDGPRLSDATDRMTDVCAQVAFG